VTLFVDASALVAMIAAEPERAVFLDAVFTDNDPLWSPMSCWETVSSLRLSYGLAVDVARAEAQKAADMIPLRLVAIGSEELEVALDAYHHFGKGRHPARLNMGDCFAYACAKTNNARLLYKGDDFAKTDLA
jgi:ribonuclease VapC